MNEALIKTDAVVLDAPAAEAVEAVLASGDISKLTSEQRANFLMNMAKALGLNPLSRPVDLIKTQDGRLVPYFNKGATDQLRGMHKVNLEIIDRSFVEDDIYMVKARATMPSGRTDESLATVYMKGKVGDDRANQYMKCETKAKRRVTLSILGLNFLDALEVETIPAFQHQQQAGPRRLEPGPTLPVIGEVVDLETGEVTEVHAPAEKPKPVAAARKLPAVPPVAVKK